MKKNILKFCAILLTLLMLFALASCGEKDKDKGKDGSETTKPSGNNDHTTTGGKQEETTSATEPEEKDNEGEFVIPSEGIHLPIVDLG